MKRKAARYFHLLLYVMYSWGCVAPVDVSPEVAGGESLAGTLVVEATISSKLQRQVVLISRMQQVESDSTVNVREDRLFNANTPFILRNGLSPDLETGASVTVSSSAGVQYSFEESAPGVYESLEAFGAEQGLSYRLQVRTREGKEYQSTPMQTPQEAILDTLYAERIVSDLGTEGMAIYTDATGPANTAGFLRYTYEETYQIIAPNWTPLEFEIISEGNPGFGEPPVVATVQRAREDRVCYRSDPATGILLVNSGDLENGEIRRNLIRFLGRNNPIIAHRYSILVRQLVISRQSYSFYERLRNFAANDDLFSQVQPGPIEGNISGLDNSDLVIGFFDVVTETSRRLFFNFEDFFPGEPLPPYFAEDFNCSRLLSPPLPDPALDGPPSPDGPCPQSLIERLKLDLVEYIGVNADPGICEGPYFVTPRVCGDCTVIGSNVVPEFWEE